MYQNTPGGFTGSLPLYYKKPGGLWVLRLCTRTHQGASHVLYWNTPGVQWYCAYVLEHSHVLCLCTITHQAASHVLCVCAGTLIGTVLRVPYCEYCEAHSRPYLPLTKQPAISNQQTKLMLIHLLHSGLLGCAGMCREYTLNYEC
jgi:hypothetical protein